MYIRSQNLLYFSYSYYNPTELRTDDNFGGKVGWNKRNLYELNSKHPNISCKGNHHLALNNYLHLIYFNLPLSHLHPASCFCNFNGFFLIHIILLHLVCSYAAFRSQDRSHFLKEVYFCPAGKLESSSFCFPMAYFLCLPQH